MPSPVLRQLSFRRPLDAEGDWGPSWYSDLANGFALGSVETTRDAVTLISALLQPLPDWNSTELQDPFFVDGNTFGLPGSSLDGRDLLISESGDSAWLSLWALEQQKNLLIHLTQLADTPSPSAAYSFAYPIEQLLLPAGAEPVLVTVGNNVLLGSEASGPAERTYALTSDYSAPLDLDNTTFTPLTGEIFDSLAIAAEQPLDLARVTVATTAAPLASGASPKGDSDVVVSARAKDGSLLWESLFGNSSIESEPRVATSVDPDDNQLLVYVGATLNGSLDLNLAGGNEDIAIASYSAEGEVLWTRILGNDGNQVLTDLQVTDDGTLLVLGVTTSNQNGDGLYGQEILGTGEDIDAFVTAYSQEGTRLWTHQFGSDGDDIAIEMNLTSLADVDPITGQENLTDTIVVAGWREPAPSQVGDKEAWIQLLTLPDADTNEIPSALLPPPMPALNWVQTSVDSTLGLPLLVVRPDQAGSLFVSLQGTADPGVDLSVRLALADGTELAAATALANAEDGRWQHELALVLEGFSSSQLGEALILVEATNEEGLSSDTLVEPVLLTGSGLPGELPQVLPIDPDGPEGSQAPSLLLRQITRLGTGPFTTANQRLLVDYTGTFTDGVLFDSSLNPGRKPFELSLGSGQVIKGWDVGLQGLPLGSTVELVIPSPLAYGPVGTETIPGGATLVFIVDLRADLTLPEAFLSQLVWPDLFNADYTQDLLQISNQYGASHGTPSDDEVRVTALIDDWPYAWPLIALAGDGDDQLLSTTNPAILFGEWGNDSLTAGEGSYAFLDGGEGNDRLETNAFFTWARGGSGADALTLPAGDWRLLGQNLYGESYWYEFGRLEQSISEDDSPEVKQIVIAHEIETIDLSPTAFAADFLEIQEISLFQTFTESTIELLDEAIDLSTLTQLLSQTSAKAIDLTGVSELTGTLAELEELLAAESVTGVLTQDIVLTDVEVTAASVLHLLDAISGQIHLQQLEQLSGTATERNQVFNADRLVLDLVDDQPPEVIQVTSSAKVIAPSSTASFWIEFSEPVTVYPLSGVVPQLTLSNGLTADWINSQPSGSNHPSAMQRFDLVTGASLEPAFGVQPTALVGLEAFKDQGGNSAMGLDSAALAINEGLTVGWTLDVDNDGQVTALGDGLMVIRQLFGGAFQGEALIDKAISPESPYIVSGKESAAHAVSDHIQFGIDFGLLDVDRDGQTTALGDGLMVIRHLFGGAFQGEALISKAISESSPMMGDWVYNDLSLDQKLDIAQKIGEAINNLV